MAPTAEVLAGMPAEVRRRTAAGTWCTVDFLPWRQEGRVVGILGRIVKPDPAAPVTPTGLPEKVLELRDQGRRLHRLDLIESEVPGVRLMADRARLAAATPNDLLLQGPAGAGKEWLARTIHGLGPRRGENFAVVDAGRFPPQELANLLVRSSRLRIGGLLIRNPGRLAAEIIDRLLDRTDVRPRLFVSVREMSELAALPEAFTAAVSVLTIAVPPLSARRGDLPRLVPNLADRAAAAAGVRPLPLSADATDALRLHAWPGNFGELLDVLREAHRRATGDRIALADLPLYLRTPASPPAPLPLPLDEILEKTERRLIQLALEQSAGNRSKAAETLKIWRARLLRRMEQLGLGGPAGEANDA
jgi:DNA-binding NtrC family response regulator